MPIISVTVENGQLVRKGLADLAAEIPQLPRKVIYDKMNLIAESMRKYPPPRAGSKYVRTYTLRDSVELKKLDNGYAIEIDPVQRGRHYGKYVIGDAYGRSQAWMHKGRWHLFAEVTKYHLRRLPDDMENHLRSVALRAGLKPT